MKPFGVIRAECRNLASGSVPNNNPSRPSLSMPLRTVAASTTVIVLLSPFILSGEEASSANTANTLTEIRRELLSEYKFSPPGTKATTLPTSLHSEGPPAISVPATNKKDVVRMEPFEVHESGVSNSAYQPLSDKAPDTPSATLASRFGIGVHHFQIGKTHMFVSTIFYVPFIAGFEW